MTTEEAKKSIRVWKFSDAPASYRELSEHGGDEDWLAYVPEALADEWFVEYLTRAGGPFGVCSVSRHELSGVVVFIGTHA